MHSRYLVVSQMPSAICCSVSPRFVYPLCGLWNHLIKTRVIACTILRADFQNSVVNAAVSNQYSDVSIIIYTNNNYVVARHVAGS